MTTLTTTRIEQLIDDYLLNCTVEGKSRNTLAIYGTVLRNFIWYCHQNGFPESSELKAMHIRQFLLYLSEPNRWGSNNPAARKPASRTTVNDYYRVLQSFFNWMESENSKQENPFNKLKPPKTDNKVIEALTENEIKFLLKQCSAKTALDVRNKAIISILLDSGLRVSELVSINLNDIAWETHSILIRQGKGGKQRVAHMGSRARKALWKYIRVYRNSDSDRVFINRNGDPLDAVGIKILIKRLGQKTGVKVHPHKLRHTYAISYLRNGGDAFTLQYSLGHSTLQMTQRYLQSLNANDAGNAHIKYSPLDNLGKI